MFKIPKIIVTNVDEDPAVKKKRRRKQICEICVLFSIVAINWIMVISKSCFVFGVLSGIITTLITIMQYCLLVKTRYATQFGAKRHTAKYQEHMLLSHSFRWTLARLIHYSASIPSRLKRNQRIVLPQEP